jgi:formylglycine-generating enzyme required for sulfatase activity
MRIRLWLIALMVAGCGPSQLLLYVDTDAVVPPASTDGPDPRRPPPLFDQLRIEILRGGMLAADDAQRDFAIDAGMFRDGRVSIGVAPGGAADLVARVRMFRGDRVVGGRPPVGSALDTSVHLPAVDGPGEVRVSVILHTDDVGAPIGADTPIDPTPGAPNGSLVGSWPDAARVDCVGTADANEVCVPGGAFWLGQPDLTTPFQPMPVDERLVVVSPFFLDLGEVTVGHYRAHVNMLTTPYNPTTHEMAPECTATTTPGTYEDLPLNCASKETADDFCRVLGKVLPSEAQYEFVASGRGLEWIFPWGGDAASCDDAVFARGDAATASNCGSKPSGPAMLPPGHGRLDRVPLGGVTIVDLAGNVDEIMRDGWSDTAGGTDPGVLHDPLVPSGTDADNRVIRGGTWVGTGLQLAAAWRQPLQSDHLSVATGFRCARAGR